jgi:hypothetical protein
MPDPLPFDIVSRLRSDSTAALAGLADPRRFVSRHRFVGGQGLHQERQAQAQYIEWRQEQARAEI